MAVKFHILFIDRHDT